MKSTMIKTIVLLVVITTTASFIFSGCYYDKSQLLNPNSNSTVDCSLISSKFATDINPIIQSKCAISGCHNNHGAGGVVLLNYAQISSAKNKINSTVVVYQSMPTSGPLNVTEISKIKCWIDSGAPNN